MLVEAVICHSLIVGLGAMASVLRGHGTRISEPTLSCAKAEITQHSQLPVIVIIFSTLVAADELPILRGTA